MLESENIYSCTEVWFWGTLSISFGLFLRFLLPLRVKQYFLLCCIFLHIYYSFRKTARLKSATVTICSTAKSAVCSVARRTTLAAATWCDLKFLYDFIRLSLHCFSSWMLGDIPLRTALFNSHHSISFSLKSRLWTGPLKHLYSFFSVAGLLLSWNDCLVAWPCSSFNWPTRQTSARLILLYIQRGSLST